MSAGSGIAHSEVNPYKDKEANTLQIWVLPKLINIPPRYEQKTFEVSGRENKWQTVVSPDTEDNALWVNQDTWFSLTRLSSGQTLPYEMHHANSGAYIFVIEGDVEVGNHKLSRRDAIGIWESSNLTISANTEAEVLLIEVPMLSLGRYE